MTTPTGCILIDTRSVGARLPRQLAMVEALPSRHRFELVVIDDTRDPRLPDIVRRFGARLVSQPRAPLGHRLNEAIARCGGEVLIFPGFGNATPAAELWRQAARVAAQEVDAITLPAVSRGVLDRLRVRLWGPSGGDGVCLARRWFERIGGCDDTLDRSALADLLERLRACGARIEGTHPLEKA